MSKSNKLVYKVIYEHQEKIYELYASHLTEGALIGFIELEGLLFAADDGETINPGEEKVRQEFKAVGRTYIPVHAILRIDEVDKAHLSSLPKSHALGDNVRVLPLREKREAVRGEVGGKGD